MGHTDVDMEGDRFQRDGAHSYYLIRLPHIHMIEFYPTKVRHRESFTHSSLQNFVSIQVKLPK